MYQMHLRLQQAARGNLRSWRRVLFARPVPDVLIFPVEGVVYPMKGRIVLFLIFVAQSLAGCVADGFGYDLTGTATYYTYKTTPVPPDELTAFPRFCLAGDPYMGSLDNCIAEGVHCYQLDTGDWCAGAYSPFELSYSFY
ncbi:hypothetical protein BTJ40_03820 [Microbulbifer sp. A4B17]|nr:hypothetical protein BTJ40_03820 [Microbulbifer sp. A4B17]